MRKDTNVKPSWMLALGLGLALAGLVVPLCANAQSDDDQRARMHFQSGRSYFQDGAYDRALDEFTRAYDLSGRDVLLINMANCNERLGRQRAAVGNLHAYLEAQPEAPDRATIERRIANLERLADEQDARLAAASATTAATATTLAVPEEPAVDPAIAEPVPEEVAAEEVEGGRNMLGPIIGFSTAGVGAVMMITFGALALSEQNSLEDSCGATGSCTDDQVNKVDNYALVADIGLGLAIAGAAVGVVLLFVGGDDEEDEPQARVSPWFGRRAAGASAEVTF